MNRLSLLLSLVLVAALLTPSTPVAARVDTDAQNQTGREIQATESDSIGFEQKFRFPEDARPTSLFGIDVSHHQGEIDWSRVSDQSVVFAYVKATQGTNHLDRQFVSHWRSLEKERSIFRGAYHFMSAVAPADEQAQNFLANVGQASPGDLPPCLDLEWDFRTENGARVDRWARLSPDEIVERALVWLQTIEAATGKRPIIYTNSRWWKARIGDRKELAGYRLWIADYDGDSLRSETPWVPEGFEWVFWQITDRGVLSTGGVSGRVDANYYRGTHADFVKEFGLGSALTR